MSVGATRCARALGCAAQRLANCGHVTEPTVLSLGCSGRIFEARKPTVLRGEAALYLRSVCWITTAFRGLRCHPLTGMLLNLRLSVDSIPSALFRFTWHSAARLAGLATPWPTLHNGARWWWRRHARSYIFQARARSPSKMSCCALFHFA